MKHQLYLEYFPRILNCLSHISADSPPNRNTARSREAGIDNGICRIKGRRAVREARRAGMAGSYRHLGYDERCRIHSLLQGRTGSVRMSEGHALPSDAVERRRSDDCVAEDRGVWIRLVVLIRQQYIGPSCALVLGPTARPDRQRRGQQLTGHKGHRTTPFPLPLRWAAGCASLPSFDPEGRP